MVSDQQELMQGHPALVYYDTWYKLKGTVVDLSYRFLHWKVWPIVGLL